MKGELFTNLLWKNMKHHFPVHFLLSCIAVLLTLCVCGIAALDSREAAQPLECMLPLVGITLFTPVFLPEQEEGICELIASKRMNHTVVYVLRVLYSAAALGLLVGAFVMIMYLCESQVQLQHFGGSFASALFLGAVGFAAAGISDNAVCGYMAAMMYYLANFALKDKLGVFYLFSMYSGLEFSRKLWLIVFSVLLFAVTLGIRNLLRRGL